MDYQLTKPEPSDKMVPAQADTKSDIAMANDYEPTAREHALVLAYAERRANSTPKLKLTQTAQNTLHISFQHPDDGIAILLMADAIGTKSLCSTEGFLSQAINISAEPGKSFDEKHANFVLSLVKSIEPQDQLETMLAMQMAAIHNATMEMARRLAIAENLLQLEQAERSLNKLARTFTTQVEALKRYRSKGEQTVRVERVTVHEGGQAIVGNVTGGGGPKKPEATP